MTTEIPIVPVGSTIPPAPAEVLNGITFDDVESVVQEPKVNPVEVKEEVKPVVTTEQVVETPKEASLPSRYDNESDVQYDLRTKLFITGQAKANAQTDEEKSLLSKEMKRIREDMSHINKKEIPEQVSTPTTPSETEDAVKAIKGLGFKTAEEIESDIQKIIDQRLSSQETNVKRNEQEAGIKEFYSVRNDIYSDPMKRDALESYVLNMFKDQIPSMTKTQLIQALDMSAGYLYPRQSVSKQSAIAQAKTDALNISGSQGGDISPSNMTDNSKQKLRDMGWSESDISSFEKKV